jgi:hypothetical protein
MSDTVFKERRADRPGGLAKRYRVSRAFIYEEIRAKRLLAHKAGDVTIIFQEDEEAWRENMKLLKLEELKKKTPNKVDDEVSE